MSAGDAKGGPTLTFVIPVLNERETLIPLVEGIQEQVRDYPHDIILVDDGSTDGSYEVMRDLHARHPEIHVLRFRRNFGKSQALAAGFARAHGDIVFMMDADLQDDPAEIPRFLAKLEEGHDLVTGWKAKRRDPWHKTLPSKLYNRWISRLFRLRLRDVNSGYKAMRQEVARRLVLYGERHRLIPVFAANLGYRVTEIPVQHHPRRYGKSKYGIERFFRGASDALAVRFIQYQGQTPGHFFLRLALLAGAGAAALTAAGFASLAAAAMQWRAGGDFQPWLLVTLTAFAPASALWTLWGGFLGFGLVGETFLRRMPPPDVEAYIAEQLGELPRARRRQPPADA